MKTEKLIKTKECVLIITILALSIILASYALVGFILNPPPDYDVPPEEYAVAIPELETNYSIVSPKIEYSPYHEVVTSVGIFSVDITYEFYKPYYWVENSTILYSKNVTTIFVITLKENYLSSEEECFEKVTYIYVEGVGMSTHFSKQKYDLPSYLRGENIITLSSSPTELNIEYPSSIAIFIEGDGWYTYFFDMDWGIQSKIINEQEIKTAENDYFNDYSSYENKRNGALQAIGTIISITVIFTLVISILDNRIEMSKTRENEIHSNNEDIAK